MWPNMNFYRNIDKKNSKKKIERNKNLKEETFFVPSSFSAYINIWNLRFVESSKQILYIANKETINQRRVSLSLSLSDISRI